MVSKRRTKADLEKENEELRARLADAEERARCPSARGDASVTGGSIHLAPGMNPHPGWLVLYDAEGRIQSASTPSIELGGYAASDLIGHKDEEIFPAQVTEAYLPLLRRAFETGTTQSDEIFFPLPAGASAARVTYIPLLDARDHVCHVLAVTQDLSERLRAEHAAREMEERFAEAFRTSPIAMAIADLDDVRFIDVNDSMLRLVGYEREELVGHSPVELGLWGHPEERVPLGEAVRSGKVVRAAQVTARKKNGEVRQVELSAYQLEVGGTQCIIALLEDVTERVTAEGALRLSEERFRSMFEGLPLSTLLFRKTSQGFRLVRHNRGATEMTRGAVVRWMDRTAEEVFAGRPVIPEQIRRSFEGKCIIRSSMPYQLVSTGEDKYLDLWFIYIAPDLVMVQADEKTEQRRAEEALRKREEEFRALAENSPDLIARFDRQGRFLYINGVVRQLTERPPEDFIGKTFEESGLPLDVRVYWQYKIETVFDTGQSIGIEFEFPSARGMRFLESRVGPEFAPDGSVASAILVARDVTERKLAEDEIYRLNAGLEEAVQERTGELERAYEELKNEVAERARTAEALREREEVLQLALMSGPAGAWSWDLRANKLEWSDEYYRIFGFEPGSIEPSAEAGLSRLHPDDRAQIEQSVREARERGTSIDTVHRVVWPDGSVHWVRGISRTFVDGSGQPSRLAGVVLDITERKRAEESLRQMVRALRKSEHHYRALFDTMLQGVVYQDADGTIASMNPAAERILGKTPAEFLGQTSVSVEHDTLREDGSPFPGLEHPSMVALRTGREVRNVVMGVYNPREQQYRWIDITAVPLFREGEETPYQVYAVFDDITERKRAEAELRHLNGALEERATELAAANKELESFAYSVSHDLRAPLTFIDSLTQLVLEDYALPEAAQRQLESVRANAEAMERLIQALLTFSRTAREPLHKQRVDMRALVESVVEELGPERTGRDVEIVVGDLPDAEADPILLRQVVVNLLSNALKFTRKREKARIEIGFRFQVPGPKAPSGGFRLEDTNPKSPEEAGRPKASNLEPITSGLRPETVFFVRDNGVGFDPENADRLFGVFQRYHREDEYEGSGVGLALVERVIRRHGGRVWAEAAVDQGATVYFALGRA